MSDPAIPPDKMFAAFIEARGKALRANDKPPASLNEWNARRRALREAMLQAMGPFPSKPEALDVHSAGVLPRQGYRIEKLVIKTRPDVWATATAYVPEGIAAKVPAVLAVHGHWAGARRDPVVQARCLGLVKLGFFVLAVDAFGAGERHPQPAPGAYHGALLGSTLWPAGHTLVGMQVYDNRRMVDYLLTRSEVDGARLGITGASGGGNQTMYAGALDERFAAVVPVCSVGTYQAYLKAACCVCEVLPGALQFTEEGAVLGLVAPRALMVINATKDAYQFSVGEATKSVDYARAIFKLHGAESKLAHRPFESSHDYNRAMREAMYGWMSKWLKGEGDGSPIPEPAHAIEKPEDLACFPDGKRPAGFLFPASFAARKARRALAPFDDPQLDHKEAWESLAGVMREVSLPKVLGDTNPPPPVPIRGQLDEESGVFVLSSDVTVEPGVHLPTVDRYKSPKALPKIPLFLFLHLAGKDAALKLPLASTLVDRLADVVAFDLRATGSLKPERDAIAGAPDHNSAEHALWIGRPLLGQWVLDTRALLDSLDKLPSHAQKPHGVIAVGPACVVALCAAALDSRLSTVVLIDPPPTLITEVAYPAGTHMGLLAPGLLTVGDVPHLAALMAPRQLLIAGAVKEKEFAFTKKIYALEKAGSRLHLMEGGKANDIADRIMPK